MPKITFLKTGQTFEVPAGTSFLEFCQENDAPHDFGCTVGSCGTCCAVLTEGADQVNPVNDEEAETVEMCTGEEGARLGCKLVVNGDVSVRGADV
jgi:ferredoxin